MEGHGFEYQCRQFFGSRFFGSQPPTLYFLGSQTPITPTLPVRVALRLGPNSQLGPTMSLRFPTTGLSQLGNKNTVRLATGLPAGCSDCRAVWLSPPPWRPGTAQQLRASERYPPALLLSFPLSFWCAQGRNAWSSAAAHRGSCFAPSSEQTGSRTRGRSSSHAPAALAARNLWSTHTLLDLFYPPVEAVVSWVR